jgi:hypothetical protein
MRNMRKIDPGITAISSGTGVVRVGPQVLALRG